MSQAERALALLRAALGDRAGREPSWDWGVLWEAAGLDEPATTFLRRGIGENAAVFADGSVLHDHAFSDDGAYGAWVACACRPDQAWSAPGYKMERGARGVWRFYAVLVPGSWTLLPDEAHRPDGSPLPLPVWGMEDDDEL